MARDLIIINPQIQGGTPVLAGTRVPVKNLFDYLEAGESLDKFLDFPSVNRDRRLRFLSKRAKP